MPDLDKLFPGRFIKASEFGGKPVTVTIDHTGPEKVKSHVRGGKEETIAVVYLKETERQLHLCKTNALCIAAMFGRAYEKWGEHKVTLFAEPNSSGLSDSGLAIRVLGSPELTKPVKVKIRNPGPGEPTERTMTRTTKASGAAPMPAPEPDDEPAGEVELPLGQVENEETGEIEWEGAAR